MKANEYSTKNMLLGIPLDFSNDAQIKLYLRLSDEYAATQALAEELRKILPQPTAPGQLSLF